MHNTDEIIGAELCVHVVCMVTLYPPKNASPKMATIGGRNMYESMLFILQ
jgi:hypothetical protein